MANKDIKYVHARMQGNLLQHTLIALIMSKAKIFSSRIAKKQTSMEGTVTYTRVLRHTGEGVDGREYDVAEPTSAEWYKHFSDERMARHGGGL